MNCKLTIALCLSLLLLQTAGAQTTRPAQDQWTPIFNGKDFSGWYTYLKNLGKNNDEKKVFQVKDGGDGGVIHVYKDAEQGSDQPFGYFCTEKDYGDCKLRFQYKWGEKRFGKRVNARRDSGVLYFTWGEDGKGNGVWPYSVECQIQENDTGDTYAIGNADASTVVTATVDPATKDSKNPTYQEGGVPYTSPTTGNNRIVRNPMLETEGWNAVEIVMQGDAIAHIVNGKVNMRLTNATRPDPDKPGERLKLTKGRILFQAEGAEILYRNIEIQPLGTGSASR